MLCGKEHYEVFEFFELARLVLKTRLVFHRNCAVHEVAEENGDLSAMQLLAQSVCLPRSATPQSSKMYLEVSVPIKAVEFVDPSSRA